MKIMRTTFCALDAGEIDRVNRENTAFAKNVAGDTLLLVPAPRSAASVLDTGLRISWK